MSTDKEHLERRIADSLACGKHLDAAEYITLLVQLVADEAALPPQPVAAGDVPEWLATMWKRCFPFTPLGGQCVIEFAGSLKSELSRRVAEATAAKDAELAKLEKLYNEVYDDRANIRQCLARRASERDKAWQQLAASQAEVERLKRDASVAEDIATIANQRGWDGVTNSKFLSVFIESELDDLERIRKTKRRDCDERTAELTKLREEVARLKDMSNFEERANAWSMIWKTCNEVGMDSFKCDEYSGQGIAVAFIRHLASEVTRLSRPVDVDWDAAWLAYIRKDGPALGALRHAVEPLLQSERNAREAAEKRAESAEAERDELREAWAMFTVGETVNGCHKAYALAKPSDERNNVVLAAYREEKGKVAK